MKSDGKSRQIFPSGIDFVGRFTQRSGSERRDRTIKLGISQAKQLSSPARLPRDRSEA
jgi:hypothetical protein